MVYLLTISARLTLLLLAIAPAAVLALSTAAWPAA
jgi:hypothetical protein